MLFDACRSIYAVLNGGNISIIYLFRGSFGRVLGIFEEFIEMFPSFGIHGIPIDSKKGLIGIPRD